MSLSRVLRGDRLALGSGFVLLAYAALALSIVSLGWIGRDDTRARVGPGGLWGFGTPNLERRIHAVEGWSDPLVAALAAEDPAARLAEIDYLGRRPFTLVPGELAGPLERVRTELDELYQRLESEELVPGDVARMERLEAASEALYVDPPGAPGTYVRLARLLGTDVQGSSIALRALYAAKVSVELGLSVALAATLLGALLGGLAGLLGGVVDRVVVALFSLFAGVPTIVLLLLLAAAFAPGGWAGGRLAVGAALVATLWVGPCRVIRAEVRRLRGCGFVEAARALGLGPLRILGRHLLPSTAHLLSIQFALGFVAAVKAEAILSFLDLGVRDEPSFGVMIHASRQEILSGFYWQIGAAGLGLGLLILALQVLADALGRSGPPAGRSRAGSASTIYTRM